ncbi:unnamed protein product [Eruca vesicaria subsp. sativa]|uniref:EF-hand domain-containing protein n=1 Tax=Eruca vesicaria subsp. sativa TaxID=29727 RepID=A0ABC8JTZ9_ERUVS|nr:unnamed protein product [Eruca vesicaria subsp. sativa]
MVLPDEAAMLEKISTVMLNKLKVEKLKEDFRICDVDQNGFITEQELRYVMSKDGRKVTDREVRKIIKASDVNGDGRISFDEIVKFIDKTYLEKVRWWECLPQKLHCPGRKRKIFFKIFGL